MKQPSSSFDGGKQQAPKCFLLNGAGSSKQNQPIHPPSTRSESVQRTRQPPSPRRRSSTQNPKDSSVGQANRSQNEPDKVQGLADLIWKYFEPEIREALLEAQESLADNNDQRTEQLSNGSR